MHFGHENVIRFDNRPFADANEMDKCMLSYWNMRVTKNDTVYILGDAFWKNEEQSTKIINQLKGRKILIKGNHDKVVGQLKQYYDDITDYAEISDIFRCQKLHSVLYIYLYNLYYITLSIKLQYFN